MTEGKTLFLGEEIGYWLALKQRAQTLGVDEIMRELVAAQSKAAYYERHIRMMEDFRKAADGK